MPTELQVIRAQEFIRLGARGNFDLAASRAALAQLGRACCKRGITQALLDLRELHPGPKPVFSPGDLVKLVNTFREIGFTHRQRLAVLYGSDPHHRARLFSFIATLRGWKVQAFDGYEQAIHWLAGGEPAAELEMPARAKKVPIRHLKNSPSVTRPGPQPRIIVKSTAAPIRPAPVRPVPANKSYLSLTPR